METKPTPPQPHNPKPSAPKVPWQKTLRDASTYLGLGMQLAAAMTFFALGGYLLDRHFGLTPWLTIAGSLLGITAIFLQIYRVSKNL